VTTLTKIISGGQTGVDRGALDAAITRRFPCGGWCPEGRRAEDGAIAERYPVTELPGAGYRQRTKRNVIDSDGTLIIFFGELKGGTKETLRFCKNLGKPVHTVNANITSDALAAAEAVDFITHNAIGVLNVAGPRESSHPGAREYAEQVVGRILEASNKGRK
jgi:predicted Rossmann fold nucleotide-binding protein DprA/Smf involved in DNA uptake